MQACSYARECRKGSVKLNWLLTCERSARSCWRWRSAWPTRRNTEQWPHDGTTGTPHLYPWPTTTTTTTTMTTTGTQSPSPPSEAVSTWTRQRLVLARTVGYLCRLSPCWWLSARLGAKLRTLSDAWSKGKLRETSRDPFDPGRKGEGGGRNLFVCCLTSQQHASVSHGRICSHNCTLR